MTRKNAAWLDATNPKLAQMVATAGDAVVTQTVEAIVSDPVTARTAAQLRERRHLAAFLGDCQQALCPVCGASRS